MPAIQLYCRDVPAPAEDRRAELLDVLLRLIAERGLEGATIRALADAAGVSVGAVQHHFRTKDDLLLSAFRRTGEDLEARADRIGRRALSARAAVRGILLELLPLDARREAELRVGLAFAARAMTVPALRAELASDLEELRAGLAEGFAAAKVEDPRAAATAAMALVDGLATQLLFADAGAPTPDEAIAAVDAHLDRVLTRRRGRRS
ncbi:TetR/AcrR family transcriptional regulator [Patulibacter sp. SYSU D01012]|uniref:TetR/AcrR family transcriptional regulator n=1 Tax=Patulibacter sp. SYSU D01012 TaxID=2817381 RepID=UPI001B30F8FB|nr:TetR/AcrR family transcriptional regulator [Patulibacter sp. SYSU D01012]